MPDILDGYTWQPHRPLLSFLDRQRSRVVEGTMPACATQSVRLAMGEPMCMGDGPGSPGHVAMMSRECAFEGKRDTV